MDLQTVLKKINKIKNKKQADKLRRVDEYSNKKDQYYLENALNALLKKDDALAVPYRPRLQVFKEGRLYFNPVTMHATSYGWYHLVKVIEGKVIVNNYGYSQQTNKHQYSIQALFKQLGIKYYTLEAPRGLQDLGSAKTHVLEQYAVYTVLKKYSRDGKGNSWLKGRCKHDFKILALLGVKITDVDKTKAVEAEEKSRRNKLDYQKEKRAFEKSIRKMEVVLDEQNNNLDQEGLHIVRPPTNEVVWATGDVGIYAKREAAARGLKRVVVHPEKPSYFDVMDQISDATGVEPTVVFAKYY